MFAPLFAAVLHVVGSAVDADCPLQEKAEAVSYALSALSEHAHARHVSDSDAGAVLLMWREEACELASEDARLLESTQEALRGECLQVVPIGAGTEAQYLEAAKAAAVKRQPTMVSLAWATKTPQHARIAVVTDGASGMRVEIADATKETLSRCTAPPLRWSRREQWRLARETRRGAQVPMCRLRSRPQRSA